MNLGLDLIPNIDKAYKGEDLRTAMINALIAVNEEHHRKMYQLPPYGPGDDDPSGHIIEDTEEEETNG